MEMNQLMIRKKMRNKTQSSWLKTYFLNQLCVRFTKVKSIDFIMALALLFFSSTLFAVQPLPDDKAPENINEPTETAPNISQIVTLASDLSTRLNKLEIEINDIPDVQPIVASFLTIESKIEKAEQQLQAINSSQKGNYAQYLKIRRTLSNEKILIEQLINPIAGIIEQLDKSNREWLIENQRWRDWRTILLKSQSPQQLRVAFDKAEFSISKAQTMIAQQFDALMTIQVKSAELNATIDIFTKKIIRQAESTRIDSLIGKYAPMYSPFYYSQVISELSLITWNGLTLLSWADSWSSQQFLSRHIFFYSLLLLLFIITGTVLYRSRQVLNESERWRFLVQRPVSTLIFICALTSAIQLELSDGPVMFMLITTLFGGVAYVRLFTQVLEKIWQKQVVYAFMMAYLLTLILLASNIPTPILRLYVFIVSLAGLKFCLAWVKDSAQQNERTLFSRLLRLIAVLCIIIIIGEFFGQAGVTVYLFKSVLVTMSILLPMMLFVHIIRGGLHWLYFISPLWEIKSIRNDAKDYLYKTSFLIEATIFVFIVFPAVLVAWNLFDSIPDALSYLLSIGFTLGEQHISIGLIIITIGALYSSFFASQILPQVLLDENFSGRHLERGVRNSIGRLIRYSIILIGFMVAMSIIGFDLTKLTIVLSALGIGIGFGLQSIVNNFMSGLILLFERPLREGDTIEIDSKQVQILKIGLRATTVQTFENANIIIPNGDLIANQVTNWTLTTRQVRLSIPVGVAYGTDVSLVEKILLQCAADNETVLKSPASFVLFINLGDSSLNFELRVWVPDADGRITVKSQLYYAIVKSFNEANIVIPFPQRDIHIYNEEQSVEQSALLRPDDS